MNPGRRKKIVVTSLVLLYIAICFWREFVFLNINEQSRVTFYHANDSHVSDSMQWLSYFSYSTLYYAKWPLTFLFTVLFAFLAATIIRKEFEDHTLSRFTWFAYAAVFVTGLLFYLAGSLFGDSESTYDIARFLAGLTETPAMLVILSASFLALRRLKSSV